MLYIMTIYHVNLPNQSSLTLKVLPGEVSRRSENGFKSDLWVVEDSGGGEA